MPQMTQINADKPETTKNFLGMTGRIRRADHGSTSRNLLVNRFAFRICRTFRIIG